MKIIAPSILSADFSKLGDEVRAVDEAGADWIHIDVMDGHFVPNITLGPMITEAVNRVTDLPLDVHLMIENPDRYIPEFIDAGADYISVHVETCPHLNRTVDLIRKSGGRPGAALNPATPLSAIEWILDQLDFVLLMSVNPGFGGQAFIENSLDRVRAVKNMIESRKLHTIIQIDGGVNSKTIRDISASGVDSFVAGSAIFKSPDYRETIENLKKKIG